jgi:MFS transporter, MHS family, shikimate and dehydroshikimate transport protein
MSEIMEKLGGEEIGKSASVKRVALASWIGTTIEWYDFYLYGTAAALVFNKLFFPQFDPLVGTLAAFATFWVGFGARPIGGIVFGHFGDKIGRKSMLILTLLLMGISTCLIGLLPTYATIGAWAAVLLVILRFIEGFAVGGEWGGAVLMATEHAPQRWRGFFGSWPQMGVPAGLLLSTFVFRVVTGAFSPPQFLAIGWRIPFLLSIVLIFVGLFIRLGVTESPVFKQVKETHTEAKLPILDVLRSNGKNVLLAVGMFLGPGVGFYLFNTFLLAYGTTQLKLPSTTILNTILISAVVFFICIPAAGALSDIFGRKPVYIAGAILLGVAAFPIFWLIDSRSAVLITLALVLSMVTQVLMYGPMGVFFSELFGTRVRYSGASLGYQVGGMLVGLVPFVATALLAVGRGASWPIALFLIVIDLISFVSVLLTAETRPSAATPLAQSGQPKDTFAEEIPS